MVECSREKCKYRKAKPDYTVIDEHHGKEGWYAFCDKVRKFITGEIMPPEWCPLT